MKIKSDNLQDLLIAEEKAVDEAVNRAVRHALLAHKRAGNPVASWENGKVVMIPAEKIPVDERKRRGER
jgi:hypothetical protein